MKTAHPSSLVLKRPLMLLFLSTPGLLLAEDGAEEKISGQIDWMAEVLKGGWTSMVLIAAGICGLAFILERFLAVRRGNFVPDGLVSEIRPLWRESRFEDVIKRCEANRSIYSRLAEHVARHVHVPFDIVAISTADLGAREVKRQIQRAFPIAVVAMIAPLLGLLGTIIGMIEAFQKVAILGDTGDPAVLADSIGKALITTALGLIIAIPSLVSYHYFKQRINLYANALEEEVDELFSLWLKPEDKGEAASKSDD